MASPSAGHGSLSFTTYGNKKPAPNKDTTHSSEPWKGPLPSLNPLPTHAPPCNLTVGSLLVRIPVPYSFHLIGSLPSALALLVLYKSFISLPCRKMETVCVYETSASTNISTWHQNPKIKKHENNRCENPQSQMSLQLLDNLGRFIFICGIWNLDKIMT
jgi:hypothetical protein